LFPFDQAKAKLKDRLLNLLDEVTIEEYPSIFRVEIPLEKIDILNWLYQQSSHIRIYWSSRDGQFESAGINAAHVLNGRNDSDFRQNLLELKRILFNSSSKARYYGGIRFQRGVELEEIWKSFGCCRFMLPLFEVTREERQYQLAANIYLTDKRDTEQSIRETVRVLENLQFNKNVEVSEKIEKFLTRFDFPNREQWERNVKIVLKEFEHGELQKVVLARKSLLKFTHTPDPVNLLYKLKKRSPHAFHFLIQLAKGKAFLGATPECLYKRSNGNIYSEALAGTRPRGENSIKDKLFEEELQTSPKEIREHRVVSQMVGEALQPLCNDIKKIEDMAIIKLTNVQHLISRFKGFLISSVVDHQIIDRLHPTPAVGGLPKNHALKRITELEPFDRGWYAGPIGWIGSNSAEFAVAIRSALVFKDTITLYAGSGIVPGSDPQAEWEEIENKILNFKKLLHLR